MSGSLHAWYSVHDLESLAARRGALSGEIELAKLPRLAALLHSAAGSVRASLRPSQRGEGGLVVTLEYEATVELICQRCLEPFHYAIAERVDFVPTESSGAVPAGCEPLELEEGRLKPASVIEDELIVSVPLVPKHPRVEDCGSLAADLSKHELRPDAASDN
jgi:DUF177 domain-containing protein